MNDQLKQRLVGAIVLVSLAVIFIPVILPGNGGDNAKLISKKIPPEPDYRFPPPKEPPKAPSIGNEPIVPIGDSAQTDDKHVAKSSSDAKPDIKQDEKTVPKAEEQKAVASATPEKIGSQDIKSGQTTAWIVQVGSFSSEPNARALRDKLRKLGYACFVEAVKGGKGMVYRVRVGPELTRTSAEKLNSQLAKKAKVKGLVQAYP